LPLTVLKIVPAPVKSRPIAFPEMTFLAAAVLPPIVLLFAAVLTAMPQFVLPSAASPAAFVPM
jgi:hypothetical protein